MITLDEIDTFAILVAIWSTREDSAKAHILASSALIQHLLSANISESAMVGSSYWNKLDLTFQNSPKYLTCRAWCRCRHPGVKLQGYTLESTLKTLSHAWTLFHFSSSRLSIQPHHASISR